MTNLKDLKKLATLCRKLGITQFKTPEFEFTLSDEIAESRGRKSKSINDSLALEKPTDVQEAEGRLSQEDLLFWSSSGPEETLPTQQ